MMKRRFTKMLTHGMGSQLFLLLFVAILFFVFFIVLAALFGWNYGWQDILALFLDPGVFGGAGEHDWFRLTVTLVGVLLFSTLLISLFNNIFDNISESAKSGMLRYRVKGHILILGTHPQLMSMLEALHDEGDRRDIVVMTQGDVQQLNAKIDTRFGDQGFMDQIILYHGAWDTIEELKTVRPQLASRIYVIGESDSADHDSMNMRCCDLLKTLCESSNNMINCYVMMENGSSIDIHMKETKSLSTDKLKIDIVNAREYAAEQVLAPNEFLPIIRKGDPRRSHLVVLGISGMTKAMAFTVAHNSHYPRLDGAIRKTRISIIGQGMKTWMDNLVASRPGLFERSVYTYVDPKGQEQRHEPKQDYLDVEWEFIDMNDTAPLARTMMETWALDRDHQMLSMALCHDKQNERIASLLHLPKVFYDKEHPIPICVYLENGKETALRATQTGNYGLIKLFGPAMGSHNDPLFVKRSDRGSHVNAIYLVGKAGLSDFDLKKVWYESSESDKFASIYCANALEFRWINFDPLGDREALYEAEHRRWMMSKLLMGLEHPSIGPYEEVADWKMNNFKNVVDGMIEYNIENGRFKKQS